MPSLRVVIASRVYAPEVSAASGLLQSWAMEFRDRGCEVTVATTRVPDVPRPDDEPGIRVRRAPVLRDRQRYVRGYLPYLSFDLPLALRLLFGRRADIYVVEPPPTTIAVVVAIARLKHSTVVVDAADIWSDAAAMATRSRLVLRALRWIEVWAFNHASHLFAAHAPLVARARELGVRTPATAIGFGADTRAFRHEPQQRTDVPLFVYAGTHSEWHGASIFVDAFAAFLRQDPRARLTFFGNGTERSLLRERAEELGVLGAVELRSPIPPRALAPLCAFWRMRRTRMSDGRWTTG
jgi:glycosyltransferase involved in cell wall biosynthesis